MVLQGPRRASGRQELRAFRVYTASCLPENLQTQELFLITTTQTESSGTGQHKARTTTEVRCCVWKLYLQKVFQILCSIIKTFLFIPSRQKDIANPSTQKALQQPCAARSPTVLQSNMESPILGGSGGLSKCVNKLYNPHNNPHY